MIGCPVKTSEEWKKIVKDIKEKFNVDDKKADDLASYAFHTHGEMPTSERAISILEAGVKFTTKKTVKQGITSLFRDRKLKSDAEKGYAFGMAEGKVIGAVEQAKLDKGQPDEALKAQEKERKEFVKLVSEYLNNNEKLRGKLSEAKIDAITRKASNVGTSEKNFNKFADYVDKVISAENYATDLKAAESFQKKMKTTFAETKDIVKRMKNLDIERLTPDELTEFNRLSQQYINSTKAVTFREYAPFDKAKSEKALSKLEKAVSDSIIKEAESVYDILGLTEEEVGLLNDFMDAENKDEFYQNLNEAKKKTLRYNLERTSEYAKIGLQEFLIKSKAEMTAKYGKELTSQLEDISNMDVSLITNPKDLAEAVKTINNSIINNSNSNVGKVHATVKAYERLPNLISITSTVVKPIIGALRKSYYDTPIILKAIFGSRRIAAAVRYMTGYEGVISASSSAETQTSIKKKAWVEFKKKNQIDNSAETDTIMGIYSRLNDVKINSENVDFINEKKQLRASIDRLLVSENGDDIKFGELLERFYNENVEPHETHSDFIESFRINHPKEIIGADWISQNLWKEKKQEFKNHAESNLNETFDADERNDYHPKVYYRTEASTEVVDPSASRFELDSDKPRETGRSKERTLKGDLPKGKVVDYRFEYNTFKNYQDELFEIGSFHDAMLFHKMANIDGFSQVFGGAENSAFFEKTYNIQYKILREGKRNLDELNKSTFVAISRTVKNLGSSLALGRISQVLSQATPGLSTAFQAPKYLYNVLRTKGLGNIELYNLSTIGARGEELGSAGKAEGVETLAYGKLKTGWKSALNWAAKKTGQAREIVLKPLASTDVSLAKKSFLSYYLKYMNEIAGVKVSAKDLSTEHLRMDETRKTAISYAQQAVDETQGVSNRVMLSVLKRNDGGNIIAEVAKNTLIPFNNFSSNSKARLIEDINKGFKGNAEQKKEAWTDIAGSLTEAAGFSAINAFVVTGIWRYGLKSVMAKVFGLEESDESALEYTSKRFKMFYTGFAREIILSGFGGAVESGGINLLNRFAYHVSQLSSDESGVDYYTWLKQDPLFKPPYEPSNSEVANFINGMGGYGIAFRAVSETGGDLTSYVTKNVEDKYSFKKFSEKPGKKTSMQMTVEKDVPITDEQRHFFLFLGMMEGVSLLGLGEQDLIRAAQSMKQDIIRGGSSTKSSEKGFGKEFSSGGFGKKFK